MGLHEKINGKMVFEARKGELWYARDLWPQRQDIPEDAYVLVCEMQAHDNWHPTRTSLVHNVDRETWLVETRNSFYRLTDAKIQELPNVNPQQPA